MKVPEKDYVSVIGKGGQINVRKSLMEGFVDDLVQISRATHINQTIIEWRLHRQGGALNENVAIIVDGSPSRPFKNVRLGGSIDIIAEADLALMIEATTFAWTQLIKHATKRKGDDSTARKGHSMRYHTSFEMFVSDKRQIGDPRELVSDDRFTTSDWVTIHNYVPYAAKLERYRYPQGSFWAIYKKVRAKYGNRLAVAFAYVDSSDYNLRRSKTKAGGAIANAQPVIRIGQPGAFPSKAVNLRKTIRDARNRG